MRTRIYIVGIICCLWMGSTVLNAQPSPSSSSEFPSSSFSSPNGAMMRNISPSSMPSRQLAPISAGSAVYVSSNGSEMSPSYSPGRPGSIRKGPPGTNTGDTTGGQGMGAPLSDGTGILMLLALGFVLFRIIKNINPKIIRK